jgi:catechol 2,3-dioxygenase
MTTFSIHPDTKIGPVHLNIADLSRAVEFYRNVIGLQLLHRSDDRVWMGAGGNSPLLVLTEKPDAHPIQPQATGLYHLAILVPTRLDLARSLQHLIEGSYPIQGMSDHLVSEAIYLSDPDGNGIEIYTDRPRDLWRSRNGQLELATVPLNVSELLTELEQDGQPWNGLPAKTRIGHVHLHVSDLDQAETFYCDLLGFDMISRYGPSASFVSAGGYHHHIGMNTWAGVGVPSPPADGIGLSHFTIQLPDEAALRDIRNHLDVGKVTLAEQDEGISLRDPSNNGILLTVAP